MPLDLRIIEKHLGKIPHDVRMALLSENHVDSILEIGQNNKVPEEKISNLFDVVGMVMLGLLRPEHLNKEINDRIRLGQDASSVVTAEIQNKILRPLNASLKKIYETQEKSTEKPTTSQPSSTPQTQILERRGATPSNLPTAPSHLEPMIRSKDQNPFLPPLVKSRNVKLETLNAGRGAQDIKLETLNAKPERNVRLETLNVRGDGMKEKEKTEIGTQNQKREVQSNAQEKKPDVTSALAAEISNLLNKPSDNLQSTTYNKQPQNQKVPEVKKDWTPPAEEKPVSQIPPRPEDKMSAVVQTPRVEVEMVRKEPEPQNVKREASDKRQADPYREPIEWT